MDLTWKKRFHGQISVTTVVIRKSYILHGFFGAFAMLVYILPL